ncbi:MAG: molecular chaperone TorD family protein [Bacteroidales bacterium]|nr:molecular chaperone TorD family protein [Bacteroidales bacterium]
MDLLDVKIKRAEIINLFSALFCQPEEEVTKSAKTYESLTALLEVVNSDCIPAVKKLKDSAAKYTIQELMVEYARLFIGPFKIPAPPYSSMYFPEKTLMSNVTLWVMEMYKQAGLNFDTNLKDLPDHVVVESQFLYYLLFNQVTEFKNGNLEISNRYNDLLHYFVNKHYRIWVPEFCNTIIENTSNSFYKALATCFEIFVRTWVVEGTSK